MLKSRNSDNKLSTVDLVRLNQTHICFDVDQLKNARHEIILSRCAGIQDDIAWRIRTNVPTRYIIAPARGLIKNDNPVTLTVELMENKFHPNHKLTFHAIVLINGYNESTIWGHDNAKKWNNVQRTALKLSTVPMNIERSKYEEEAIKTLTEDVKSLKENSSRTGKENIQELEFLLSVLHADTKQFKKNTERTIRLKTILEHALDTRKESLVELKRRVLENQQETKKLKKILEEKEIELQIAQKSQTTNLAYPVCCIS